MRTHVVLTIVCRPIFSMVCFIQSTHHNIIYKLKLVQIAFLFIYAAASYLRSHCKYHIKFYFMYTVLSIWNFVTLSCLRFTLSVLLFLCMVLCFSALAMHVWSQGEISRGGWGLRGKPNIPIKLLLEAYTPLSMFCIIQVNLTLAAACLTPVLRFAFSIIATWKQKNPIFCRVFHFHVLPMLSTVSYI